MFSEYSVRNYNFRLLIYVLALNIIGLAVINSAVGGDMSYIGKQLFGLFVGLFVAAVLSLLNYHYLMKLNWIVYIGCVAILAAVIMNGQLRGGSTRWIILPFIGQLQPSEFTKIGLIFFFSWYLQKYQERINQPSLLLTAVLLAAIPLFLILSQPDLSTSIVIAFFIICLIYIAGISYKWIFGALAILLPTGLVFREAFLYFAEKDMVPLLKQYQIRRILAFLSPVKYAELNLQQDNSKMAIGSGQLYGKGLYNHTAISVKNGNFLSEEHTDFIFSVIGEELGFVGCMIVIALYVLVVFECLMMAGRAKDLAGKLLCAGVAALIGFQGFANIAVATGILPNTGLPLPFISYGVSSLLSLYIGIGIVLNVGLQRKKLEF